MSERLGGGAGRRVYIIGFWPDYEAYTLDVDLRPEFRLEVVNLKQVLEPGGILRGLRRRLARRRYASELLSRMSREPESVFLFQDNIRLLDMLSRIRRNFQGGILARDPVSAGARRAEILLRLAECGIKVWSFDQDDCRRYGFTHYRQFVRCSLPDPGPALRTDLFFLGRDKGRATQLDRIQASAEAAGLIVDFTIARSHGAPVPYSEYLTRMLQSRCLVEINQVGQAGFTMRAVESLLYGKKLLTNNPAVRGIVGFDPDMVLISEETPAPEQLRQFIQRPATPPNPDLISCYEASSVLREVCRQAAVPNERSDVRPAADQATARR